MSDKDEKKEDNTMIIGAVVGSIVVILLLLGFGYFYFGNRSTSKRLDYNSF